MDVDVAMVPIICSLGLFALVGTIWLATLHTRRTSERLQSEIRLRLLERGAAGVEPSVWAAVESQMQVRSEILRGIRRGSVFLVVGVAFFAISYMEGDFDFRIPGLLCLGAGAGFGIATVVSLWLCRRWDALAG